MITINNKPKAYQPLEKLTICSNTLQGGSNLVAVGELLPILIGKVDTPQIWLSALDNAEKNQFIPIVEANISKHHVVKVYEENGVYNVSVAGDIILSVIKKSESEAEVIKLDLRPIGLNIHGDETTLYVGNGSFKDSGMSGGGTLIGFGQQNPNKPIKRD